MAEQPQAFVYDAIRTPRGRGKSSGSLHEVKPVDLMVGLLETVKDRNPTLDPSRVDDVVLGVVTPIGDQGGDIAKAAALAAGYPETVGGVQLNRFCASGVDAVGQTAARVRAGDLRLAVAGGVESVSRVPMFVDRGPLWTDPGTIRTIGSVHMGIAADLNATIDGFTRAELDAYGLETQLKAATARADAGTGADRAQTRSAPSPIGAPLRVSSTLVGATSW